MPEQTGKASQSVADDAVAEIVRLHVFISAWYRGEIPTDVFEPDFADALHDGFQNIQPSGAVLTKAELLDPIRNARGTNPDFRITIETPALVAAYPGQVVMTYVEFQQGAKNSASENRRRSSVVFETEGARPIWRYLQETGLP